MKRAFHCGIGGVATAIAALWARASTHIEYSPALLAVGTLVGLVTLIITIAGCVLVTAAQQCTLSFSVGPISISAREQEPVTGGCQASPTRDTNG